MPAPKGHKPYPGCETGGRPLKYTPEYIEKEAEAFLLWMQLPDSIYFKRFALDRGYSPNRLPEFAADNEKFAVVYEKAKAWHEIKLVEGGLLGAFNAGFTKFVMGNTCGWFEKQQIVGDTANPLEFLIKNTDGTSKELVEEKDK